MSKNKKNSTVIPFKEITEKAEDYRIAPGKYIVPHYYISETPMEKMTCADQDKFKITSPEVRLHPAYFDEVFDDE